ncbi:MAG: hypothetical protein JNN05_10990, partial [Candidatus Omnitrophica bacterium]|nr:hypothetical protein [Candidatus Omnitrophota bacterium]
MQGFYQTHPMRFMVGAFILGIVTVACMCGAAPAYAQSYFDEASIYNWFVTQ